eukprot:GHVN01031264.1.p1 GENE.GHVN01031264.1~~GHVN01031264.1.p1  ORF type:complete len:531 (+),score=125.13 GHVN01031264.1:28-1620(+)
MKFCCTTNASAAVTPLALQTPHSIAHHQRSRRFRLTASFTSLTSPKQPYLTQRNRLNQRTLLTQRWQLTRSVNRTEMPPRLLSWQMAKLLLHCSVGTDIKDRETDTSISSFKYPNDQNSVSNQTTLLNRNRDGSRWGGCSARWIGHSTYLLDFDGVTILSDPIWSDWCSPVWHTGPPRHSRVPFEIEDKTEMPHVDIVLVSHAHYDHCDKRSINRLNLQFGDSVRWMVPMGMKAWFSDRGINPDNISEMNWGDETTVKITDQDRSISSITTIYYLKTVHFSNRSLSDHGKYLWGSYMVDVTHAPTEHVSDVAHSPKDHPPHSTDPVASTSTEASSMLSPAETQNKINQNKTKINIEMTQFTPSPQDTSKVIEKQDSNTKRLYFAGDTAYDKAMFDDYGRRFPNIDLSLLPIGAYYPREMFSAVHIDPHEAVEIHKSLKSKQSLAMHWNTFKLTLEDYMRPPYDLDIAMKQSKLNWQQFRVLEIGQEILIPVPASPLPHSPPTRDTTAIRQNSEEDMNETMRERMEHNKTD